jgi:hypothetical protein
VGRAGWRLLLRWWAGLAPGFGLGRGTDAGGGRERRGRRTWRWCGWVEAKELERARALFGELTARLERDMRYFSTLPDALGMILRWTRPGPSPMSTHEHAEEVVERAMQMTHGRWRRRRRRSVCGTCVIQRENETRVVFCVRADEDDALYPTSTEQILGFNEPFSMILIAPCIPIMNVW